ncbi:MAG TPA: DUF4179 domain-containing protein [Candidatus Butyricicoccus avicola]|nr:DUF4179 domain-containing protein [Candidatus Butyricicoccus avicola]
MKRNEAWDDLLNQAEQIPDELETRLNRTIARAERREKRRRWLKPLIGVTGTAAAFILLVNSSVTFALAASRVPIVRELVEAVAFDPSLKAAVAHDYVQLVGDTYTQDGVTVTVEYLIADPMNVSVFYSLSDEQGRDLELIPHLQDTAGNALPVSMTFGEEGMEKNEGEKGLFDTLRTYLGLDKVQKTLYTWRLHATEEGVIQTQMQLHVEVRTQEIWQDADMYEMDERESQDTPAVLFTLDIPITIEPQFLQSGKIFPVGQTADVLGQKLTIDEIEVYPSNTRITWHTDPENDAWLTYLPFYLTDEDGNRVDGIRNGVSGTGNDRDYGGGAIWLDSAWYDTAEHLTVHLDDAAIVPKDQDTVLLQADGQLTGLPDYIEQVEAEGYPDEAAHTFRIRTKKGTYHTNTAPFSEFIDADGVRDSFSSVSTLVAGEKGDTFTNIYPMPQGVRYPLTLFVDFAPGQNLENPIEVHT